MLNVANLYPEWFEPTLSGTKTSEVRLRDAVDPLLEDVAKGELAIFRETGGSPRAVLCVVTRRRRLKKGDGFRYVIELAKPTPIVVLGQRGQKIPLRQGWKRVNLEACEFLRGGNLRLMSNLPDFVAQLVTDTASVGELEIRLPW
jgi:hypothetical protein